MFDFTLGAQKHRAHKLRYTKDVGIKLHIIIFIMDLSSKHSTKVDFAVVLPLKTTTCLFYNKALNVSSLDWSQG